MERRINKSVFVIPVVYIILGLVMVIFPQTTMKTFCLSLGAIAAVLGIVSLISYFSRDAVDFVYRYDFVNGVLLILLGLLFIVKMELITELIPVMLGVMVLANGIMKLQHTIDLKRIGFNGWLYVLVFSLLSLLVGAVCILQPDFIASILVILMGISFLFCGLTDFITLFFLSRRLKEFVNGAVKDTVDVTDESYESFSTSSETTYNKPVSESAENKKIDFKSIFKRKKEDTNEIPAEENKEADNISEEINSTDNPSGSDTEEKEDYPVYSGYTSGDVSSEAVDSESETGEVYEEEKSEKAETEAEETKDAMDDQVNDGEDSSEEGEQTDKESGSYNTII
ncbi:MAG: DUF308 domain-containing protein [Lachnospiraceae bacterium]|nr:DUF308 domain-containing protein [Lachnospiraceae bacterium]